VSIWFFQLYAGTVLMVTIREGIYMGAKSIGKGFLYGVTGVIADPIKGIKHHGTKGFLKGIGTGVFG